MGGVSMEWKEVIATDYCYKVADGTHDSPKKQSKGRFLITSKHIKGHSIDFDNAYYISEYDYQKIIKRSKIDKWDVIVSMIGEYCGFCYLEDSNFTEYAVKNVGILKVGERIKSLWLYYYLNSPAGRNQLKNTRAGSSQPYISLGALRNLLIPEPPREDMERIVTILSSLDRKIELNNKINADLEEMAQAIFKNWFVDFEPFKDGKFVNSELGMIPEGWKVGRLTEIASYMNGLAMQKFPPKNNEDSLPVLKIKELGQGFCGTDSDRCSCNIKNECKIHNGDVIFSWSGTLLVDVWCGGDCGLNQHLFKVTSNDYPKWFYYYWTKHHLQEFIHIAKDKAVTMGHIKRGHLEEALVAIPDNDSMEKAHELFEPILSKMISLRLENSHLSLLRDTLLPRLMSGEIEVPE